jgi:hypothetical protein
MSLHKPPSIRPVPRVAVFVLLGSVLWSGCSRDSETNGLAEVEIKIETPAKALVESGTMRPGSREDEMPAMDAAKDGWATEALSDEISKKLKRLGGFLSGASGEEVFAVESVKFRPIIPRELETIFEDAQIRVRRARTAGVVPWQNGGDKFAAELGKLRKSLESGDGARVSFKLVGIEVSGDNIATTALCEIRARKEGEPLQLNSTWEMRWAREPIAISSVETRSFEEVTGRERAIFTDETERVFEGVSATWKSLQRGIDYWQGQIEKRYHIFRFGHHGLALGDVDNDGRDDIYLPQPGGIPNILLRQKEDGSLADLSEDSGANLKDMTRSALILDLDNDGNQDLVVNTTARLLCYSGSGTGRFKLKFASEEGRAGYSMAAADYDSDGDLDLFVCSYAPTIKQQSRFPYPVPYHDANNGGANVLLRNEGAWKFSNATEEVGLGADNRRFSFAAAWEDFDNDGDQDIYVANDYGRNNLFRNDSAGSGKPVRFTDVAAEAGAQDIASGMSVSWGDANRDGYPDVYVGNMYSAAGNRIAYQRQFHETSAQRARSDLQRLARGNSLFRNVEGKTFDDVSRDAGVAMGRWAWSSVFADINNDGWADLLVANGYITGAIEDDL